MGAHGGGVGLHAAESALDASGSTRHRGNSHHRRSCDLDSEEDRRSKRVSTEFSNERLRDLLGVRAPSSRARRSCLSQRYLDYSQIFIPSA